MGITYVCPEGKEKIARISIEKIKTLFFDLFVTVLLSNCCLDRIGCENY